MQKRKRGDSATLTPREMEVLIAARSGKTEGGTARWLGITVGTVRKTRKRARAKLNASTIAEAVERAEERGWFN